MRRQTLTDRASTPLADVILTHPWHQQGLNTMVGLIHALRRCGTDADLYDFQEKLFPLILEADQRRAQVSRILKRMGRRGGTLPADAPELGSGLDPHDIESWQVEDEVFERVARQLRSIGDALAWRAFGYDRRMIVALSRSDPAGPMGDKAGVAGERAFIQQRWADGEFALHHDSTNVLRIGDHTIFHRDGTGDLHEHKTDPRRKRPRQEALRIGTQRALADGGVLPAGFALQASGIVYRTHLDGLRNVLDLAAQRTGIQGGVVAPGRAVIAANQYTAARHHSADTFGERFTSELDRYRRKIGAAPPEPVLAMWSLDQVGRSPGRPPWAIYPVPADVAASLITDAIFFAVLMKPAAVTDALHKAGVASRWLQPLDQPVDMTTSLLEVGTASRRPGETRIVWSQLSPDAIYSLMLEFVDLSAWSRQVAWCLEQTVDRDVRPWPLFADEGKTWA